MLGAIGQGPGDEAPGPRIVLVRAADIEIVDTWHVSGLVGTGSKDVACEDLFLPAHMVLDMAPSQEGYPPETEGMSDAYRLPLLPLIPHLVAAPMIGAARAAWDDYAGHLREQVSTYNRSRVAEHVTIQLKLAEAAQLVEIARLLVREDCLEAEALIAARAPLPLIDRARWRAQRGVCRSVLRPGGRPDPQRLRRARQLPHERPPAPAPRHPRGGAPDPPLLGHQRRRVRPHRRRPRARQRAAVGAPTRSGRGVPVADPPRASRDTGLSPPRVTGAPPGPARERCRAHRQVRRACPSPPDRNASTASAAPNS